MAYYTEAISKALSSKTEHPYYLDKYPGLWQFYIPKSHWLFGKNWDRVIIGSIEWYPTDDYIRVQSKFQHYDEFMKKIALKLVQGGLNVVLTLNDYSPEKKEGMIKCKYCAQFTTNVKKCDHCGGVPI